MVTGVPPPIIIADMPDGAIVRDPSLKDVMLLLKLWEEMV